MELVVLLAIVLSLWLLDRTYKLSASWWRTLLLAAYVALIAFVAHGAWTAHVFEREIGALRPYTKVSELPLKPSEEPALARALGRPQASRRDTRVLAWSNWWSGQTYWAEVASDGLIVAVPEHTETDNLWAWGLVVTAVVAAAYLGVAALHRAIDRHPRTTRVD